MIVEKDTLLDLVLDSSHENEAFDIAAELDKLFWRMIVAYMDGFLSNNGPFIEIRGHIMGSGADDFNTSFIGLMVRFGTFKARQERVMNVDDFSMQFVADFRGDDLHVASKNN